MGGSGGGGGGGGCNELAREQSRDIARAGQDSAACDPQEHTPRVLPRVLARARLALKLNLEHPAARSKGQ